MRPHIDSAHYDVPPGPFELNNIPVASGAGNAQIVVRDVFGRETTANQPYYYSTGVLERGLSEYVYSAGFVRDNFGSTSFDYGSPALLGFHRQGITDSLTAGGRFPLRIALRSSIMPGYEIRSEVTAIGPAPADPSLFTVPAGYQKILPPGGG